MARSLALLLAPPCGSWLPWLPLALVGCDPPAAPLEHVPSAPSASAPAAPVAPVPSASSARHDEPLAPLQVLRFSFASEIKAKEPTDRLEVTEPGKRVYAHMAFRNPNSAPRSVHLVFRVNGDRRTMLDLRIDPSNSFRTWAFNTLKDTDRSGQLTLEVTDEAGQTLLSEKLPIRPRKGKLHPC